MRWIYCQDPSYVPMIRLNLSRKWRNSLVDKSISVQDPQTHPIRQCGRACWVGDDVRPMRNVPSYALADLALSAYSASACTFTFRVSSTRFGDGDICGIAHFFEVFNTDCSSDESDAIKRCWELVLLTSNGSWPAPATTTRSLQMNSPSPATIAHMHARWKVKKKGWERGRVIAPWRGNHGVPRMKELH